MIEAARWTGSARNRQPWRFVIARDPALRLALSRLGAYARHLEGAPLVIGLAVDEDSGADADFDVGRAAQVLMSAAGELGYGSCPATLFPDANVTEAGRLVGLSAPWRLRWALSVGVPADEDTGPPGTRAIPSGRLPAEALVLER